MKPKQTMELAPAKSSKPCQYGKGDIKWWGWQYTYFIFLVECHSVGMQFCHILFSVHNWSVEFYISFKIFPSDCFNLKRLSLGTVIVPSYKKKLSMYVCVCTSKFVCMYLYMVFVPRKKHPDHSVKCWALGRASDW